MTLIPRLHRLHAEGHARALDVRSEVNRPDHELRPAAVLAGPDNPLIARGDAETPALYLTVRHGVEARINRSTWLQLVELADADLCLTSQGARFSLVPAA